VREQRMNNKKPLQKQKTELKWKLPLKSYSEKTIQFDFFKVKGRFKNKLEGN